MDIMNNAWYNTFNQNVAAAATYLSVTADILHIKPARRRIVMNGIDLTFSEEKKKLPVGISRFLGNPDVWDGFVWPCYSESGEDYDLTFMCQINCAEAAPFDVAGVLPKTGMLYFFYDMDNMPQETFDTNTASVIHYGGEVSALFEMLRCDHDGNDMSLPEMKIHFNADRVAGGQLRARLGETLPHGWQPFFQIYSFETDRVSIRFSQKKALIYFVDKPKLQRGDFSDVHIRQTHPGGQNEIF